MKIFVKKLLRTVFLVAYFSTLFFPIFQKVDIKPLTSTVKAGNFLMQTGGYVGNAGSLSISGLGFAPDLVIIKPSTTAGNGVIFKTTSMIDGVDVYTSAVANATTDITIDNDGFTVTGGNTNSSGVYHTWVAFGGSDCSSTGNFCVGTYIGNGTSPRLISTVGFQPDLVIVKPSGTTAAMWRSSSMPSNYAQYFSGTAQDSAGAFFTTLASNGFNVGASLNTSATVYFFIAFKSTSNAVAVGSYSGTGVAQNVTVGFVPDFVMLKSATTTGAPIYNLTESYGKSSYYFTDVANLAGGITGLISSPVSGFSVDTNAVSNTSGDTIYWAAFGGTNDTRNSNGTFSMAKGSYTGTGATGNYIQIDGLSFTPDLVIVKGNTTQYGVFRTSMMPGDSTAYLANGAVNFAGGIVSLDPGGFTIGASTVVNTSGSTYYWEAFGNAWDEYTNSGASDFYIGAYYGSGDDNINISRLPFAADMVAVKGNVAQLGVFRTSSQSGDLSSYFSATAETSNIIQAINSNGFQLGTSATVNTNSTLYYYFGFKSGTNFTVGTYTGSGATKDVSFGFQPDYMWIKHASTTAGVDRNSSLSGDGALPFTNVASQTSSITAITSTGITLSTSAYVNSNTITYRYVAWRANVSQSTPTFRMQTGGYTGNGASLSISGLGFAPDFVIIKPSTTAGNGVIFKTTSMIDTVDAYATATANGTGDITIDNDGFTVIGSKANTSGTYHTWIAFGGSDCSSTGNFCVGTYIGNGTSPRLISMVGFQPDMVIVKPSGATAPMWRSSSMPSNYAQYFSATKDDSAGAFFTTLASNGFNVGASLNTSSTVYFYIAFKNLDSKISVGSYSGTGVAQNVTVGFVPDFVMLKTNSTTGYSPIYSVPESLTKNSYYFTDTANLVGGITGLISSPVSGFSVDTNALCNTSGDTIYWASFGGSNDTRTDSGQFSMARGTYTGTGSTGNYIQIDGLSFTPDLVIVKGNTTSYEVFRTSVMPGDSTAYLGYATANFTGGIVSLDPGGFTIGTNAAVNTSGITYYWEAFGNAWNEYTNSGSSSFYIGTYFGNATDNVSVPKLPFAADMIAVKGNTAQLGVFRTSSQSGDLSSYFSATAETSNIIQAINSDGFQLGTSVTVNTNATLYYYFGFKSGPNFTVGTYTGSGATKSVSFGFQPDYMWIKHASTTAGVERSSSISGDGALPFTNVASQTSSITAITSTGITLSTSAYVNSSSVTYRYVAWRIPASSVVSISVSDGSISFGTINFGESQDTITLGDTQSVTNNGNVNVTIEIQGANTACPWTLASTVGNEQYRYDFSTNSGSVWTPLTTSYSVLDTGLTPTSSQNFDLRLWTPSSTTCTTQQTVSVTLLAVEE